MNSIKRIQELVVLLNKASDLYYNSGNTIMTDTEFDLLMKELKILEEETGFVLSNSPTHNVGAEVKTQLNKIKHTRPMLSLDKCHTVKELINFAKNDDCYLSVKCDGLTTRLIYEDGELIGAETRGDGEVGQDVLFHVKNYINVPTHITYKDKFVIDGESVIFKSDFNKINSTLPESEQFANTRNLASGTLSGLDANVTKQRHMRFIPWRVIEGIDDDSNWNKLQVAKEYGFDVVPMLQYKNGMYTEALLEEMLYTLRKTANDIGLPMDGIVMAKDSESLAISMGRTEKFFRHSIAYKFDDEKYETRLRYVDWTMGKTGVLTPTAVFNQIEIDGATVERASLHNISVIKLLGLTNHCTVRVYKANQIIPQIESCDKDGDGEIEIPSVCPICGSPTAIQKDNDSEILICTNPKCGGQLLGKLTHFVSKKAMNINGLSENTLKLLVDAEFIGNTQSFCDIYHLKNQKSKLILLNGMGQKSVENLLQSIEQSRTVKLENFLVALCIPNIGTSAAKTISKACGGDLNKLIMMWANDFNFTTLDDFGEVTAKSFTDYFDEYINEIEALACEMKFIIPETKAEDNVDLEGKTICITGSLSIYKNRDELVKDIEEHGGKVVGSVSKKTDILLTNDSSSGSTKAKKAVELNIPIISEVEFRHMIGID